MEAYQVDVRVRPGREDDLARVCAGLDLYYVVRGPDRFTVPQLGYREAQRLRDELESRGCETAISL